jgi:hypothetical protein
MVTQVSISLSPPPSSPKSLIQVKTLRAPPFFGDVVPKRVGCCGAGLDVPAADLLSDGWDAVPVTVGGSARPGFPTSAFGRGSLLGPCR